MVQLTIAATIAKALAVHATPCQNVQFQALRRQYRVANIRGSPRIAEAFMNAAKQIDSRIIQLTFETLENDGEAENSPRVAIGASAMPRSIRPPRIPLRAPRQSRARPTSNFNLPLPFGGGTGLYEHSLHSCTPQVDICFMCDHDFKGAELNSFLKVFQKDLKGLKEVMIMEMTTADDLLKLQEGTPMEVMLILLDNRGIEQ